MLELFAAAAKGDFQFELVGAAEILRGVVKCDESRDVGCQASPRVPPAKHYFLASMFKLIGTSPNFRMPVS